MPQLNRTASGLVLRENFGAGANGWTSGTGFSIVSNPALVTFGALPWVYLAPRANGQPDYDGVREALPRIGADGTWYVQYDAGNDATAWIQFVATSTDRGLTQSRAVQSIQLNNGSSGSYAAVANGWQEDRAGVHVQHRVTTNSTFNSPDVGLPADPYGWDIWHSTSINGTYTFDRTVTGTGWCDTSINPGFTLFDGTTYYDYFEGRTTSGGYKIGYATATTPTGARTINGTPLLSSTDFAGPHTPENPRGFWHSGIARWAFSVNLIDPSGNFTGRNGMVLSTNKIDWSSASKHMTQRYQAVCDTNGNAIGTPSHFTGTDGNLISDNGYVPFLYDADPRAAAPGWHRGRSIRSSVWEPSNASLHYSDATTTRHRYNKTQSHTDFVAEFEVDFAALVTGSDISFEYRTNGATGYRLIVRNDATGLLRLEKMDGTTIQDGSGTAMTSGVFLRIKIAVSGTSHQAWLDGERQINVTDATYASGTEVAFSGKNCTADIRLFHMRSSDTLTIRGLPASATINVRSFGGLPVAQITADGSGVATYAATHYPLSRIELNSSLGIDAQTNDGLLWGGDDVTYLSTSRATGNGR